ncbi:VOC family protein [Nakamurella alba]|nr:VOC family protein [Nakamurella alba]
MLDRFPLNPVLPAKDGDRARAFYRDVLGLELLSGPDDDPMMFRAGSGTLLMVTEIPGRVPPGYPMVSFLVEDIEAVVRDLKERGARMRPMPATATFDGHPAVARGDIMDFGVVRSAFVEDTEGNVLALNELLV